MLALLAYKQPLYDGKPESAFSGGSTGADHKGLWDAQLERPASAGLTQSVECDPYKVEVAGSSPAACTNPTIHCEPIAAIMLPSGHFAVIDAADYPLVSPYRWFASQQRSTVYVLRFETVAGKRKAFYLHRHILGTPKGLEVDHINWNGLDCRRSNLREVTHQENCRNRRDCLKKQRRAA